MQPSGGQSNDRWSPEQPPPAVDPWHQPGEDQGDDEQERSSGESHYSVPPIAPTSGYSDYAAPQHTSGFPTLNPPAQQSPSGPYLPPSPVSPQPEYPPAQQPYQAPQPQYPPAQQAYQAPQPQYPPAQPQFPPQQPPSAQFPTQPQPPLPTSGMPAYAPPGPLPQPPRKSSTGLVIGLVSGGVVLVLLLCVGVAFATNLIGKKATTDPTGRADRTNTPGYDFSPTPDRTTASPTPRVTARDLTTLDSATTDQTPFELNQFFPVSSFTGGGGETYTRSAAGFYSACENSGGTKFKALMKQNGCGNMAVGVYLNAAQNIMTGVMVMPLPTAANATNVFNGIKADSKLGLEFWLWCPPAGQPGANVCTSSNRTNAYRQWVYVSFHRYMIIAIALHTDGRPKGDSTALTKTDQDCLSHVTDAIPLIS